MLINDTILTYFVRYILKEAEALAAKLPPLESSSEPTDKKVVPEKPKDNEKGSEGNFCLCSTSILFFFFFFAANFNKF